MVARSLSEQLEPLRSAVSNAEHVIHVCYVTYCRALVNILILYIKSQKQEIGMLHSRIESIETAHKQKLIHLEEVCMGYLTCVCSSNNHSKEHQAALKSLNEEHAVLLRKSELELTKQYVMGYQKKVLFLTCVFTDSKRR